jgi:hypothetical protein
VVVSTGASSGAGGGEEGPQHAGVDGEAVVRRNGTLRTLASLARAMCGVDAGRGDRAVGVGEDET